MTTYKKITIAAIGLIIGIITVAKYLIPDRNYGDQLSQIRTKAKVTIGNIKVDSKVPSTQIDTIDDLIDNNKIEEADRLLIQIMNNSRQNGEFITERGRIFESLGRYDSALYYYSYSISFDSTIRAKIYRANLYTKMKLFLLANNDYRDLYHSNFDFVLPFAKTFEFLGKNDSAEKYYLIYTDLYTDSVYQYLKSRGMSITPPDSVRKIILALKKKH